MMGSLPVQVFLLVCSLPCCAAVACGSHAHTQALDVKNGVNVSWTVRSDAAELDVCVTAPMAAGGWLGTGWNVREAGAIRTPGFLMEGADLVLGYLLPDGSACVRVVSMGKPPWEGHIQPHWWGPNGPACVTLTNPSFKEENGITSMSFTRPLVSAGGHENCLKNNNSIELAQPQRQLYAGATSTQVPKDCTVELAPANLKAFGHKHNLFHGANMVTYSDASQIVV